VRGDVHRREQQPGDQEDRPVVAADEDNHDVDQIADPLEGVHLVRIGRNPRSLHPYE